MNAEKDQLITLAHSMEVPSNPMLVWMPLELFALLLNDGLALGPDDGQD